MLCVDLESGGEKACHPIRAQRRGEVTWGGGHSSAPGLQTPKRGCQMAWSCSLLTLGHGRAVTMTDFAAHRRRQRQRGMGGCRVRKTSRKRGRKKESSLRGTWDDDLPWNHSILVMPFFCPICLN